MWMMGDTDNQDAVSQDVEGQDDEGHDAERGQHDERAEENVHMVPAQRNVQEAAACTQPCKYVWKVQDSDFDGYLPPFLGDMRINVHGKEPIVFLRHLFPLDLIDWIMHNTNMYALQKGKENLAVTSEEMLIFLGINMVMGYIRYPRTRMYWSSEDGLRYTNRCHNAACTRKTKYICMQCRVALCPGCFSNFHIV